MVESWEVLILLPRGSERLSSRCFIVRQFSFRDVSQIESMGSVGGRSSMPGCISVRSVLIIEQGGA